MRRSGIWTSAMGVAVLLLATACGQGTPEGREGSGAQRSLLSASSSTSETPGCVDAASFGMLPDDGQQDGPALQAYLDSLPTGRCASICLGAGRYQLSKVGGSSLRRVTSVSIERDCVDIRGVGTATELSCEGDGGGAGADFTCLTVKGARRDGEPRPVSDVTIRDMSITGSRIFNSGEQTHLVEIGLPSMSNGTTVSDVRVHNVRFFFPERLLDQDGDGTPDRAPLDRDGDGVQDTDPQTGEPLWRTKERGGDCIRVLGAPGKEVYRPVVRDNLFQDCDRSGLGVQRFSFDVLVQGNQFVDVGDAHIDQELTGQGATSRHIYSGNVFRGGRQGDIHISISGNDAGDDSASEILVVNNVFEKRGMWLLNSRNTTISGNLFLSTMTSNQAVIHGIKGQDRLTIQGNTIRRSAGSVAGPLVSLRPHGSGRPGEVLIQGNSLLQETSDDILDFDSAVGVTVSGNSMTFASQSTVASAAFFRGTARAPEGIMVEGNRVYGPLASVVRFGSFPAGPPAYVTVTGNMSRGAARGVWCSSNGTYRDILHSSNLFEGCESPTSGCPAASIVGGVR